MKQLLTLFVLFLLRFLAQGQDLQDSMQILRVMNDLYEFLDPKEKIIYSKGFEHPINPIPVFRRVCIGTADWMSPFLASTTWMRNGTLLTQRLTQWNLSL